MDGYGLDRSEVKWIVREGMKWKEKENEKWHARMAGYECVFVKQSDALFIITVHPQGGKL
tara:strand:- start:412 stop:591 length:180 start_codon:yes stop_codon:yes gene_type:complete